MRQFAEVFMPSKEEGDAKAVEMYAASSICEQCGRLIATEDEARAVYFTGPKAWKLAHRQDCAFEMMFFSNPRMGQRLPSRRFS